MKKLVVLVTFFLTFALTAKANDLNEIILRIESAGEKTSLTKELKKLDTIKKTDDKWIISYWISYCHIHNSFIHEKAKKRDEDLDMAKLELEELERKIKSPNAEVEILKAYYSMARLAVRSQPRWITCLPKISYHLKEAREIDPSNPRIDYIKAVNVYFTPKVFGGGGKPAKPYFEEALDKYSRFTAEKSHHPNWGKVESEYFLSQIN